MQTYLNTRAFLPQTLMLVRLQKLVVPFPLSLYSNSYQTDFACIPRNWRRREGMRSRVGERGGEKNCFHCVGFLIDQSHLRIPMAQAFHSHQFSTGISNH